jgi:hypothetical protein
MPQLEMRYFILSPHNLMMKPSELVLYYYVIIMLLSYSIEDNEFEFRVF